MIDNPFVSIVIPVYKVEKYLQQCVDSVIAQNLTDIELILIDDGSPDNCPKMCDDYAAQYAWITVMHQNNAGLSSARNAGMLAAKGDYIIFMDSDDWWNPNIKISKLFDLVKENPLVDMFVFPSMDYYEGKGYFKRREHEKLANICTDTIKDYYFGLLQNGNLEVHAATKILKRSFLLDNKLFFPIGMVSEDCEWMLRLLRVVKKVQIVDEPFYVYRAARPGSITNSIKAKNIEDLLEIVLRSISYYNENPNGEYKTLELNYCAYLWFCALGLFGRLTRDEQKRIAPNFKKTSIVCKYSSSPKTKLCNGVYRLCGLHLTTFILGIYTRINTKLTLNKVKQAE